MLSLANSSASRVYQIHDEKLHSNNTNRRCKVIFILPLITTHQTTSSMQYTAPCPEPLQVHAKCLSSFSFIFSAKLLLHNYLDKVNGTAFGGHFAVYLQTNFIWLWTFLLSNKSHLPHSHYSSPSSSVSLFLSPSLSLSLPRRCPENRFPTLLILSEIKLLANCRN